MLRHTLVSLAALTAAAAAQKVDLTTTAPTQPTRYSIDLRVEGSADNSVLIDGEAMGRGATGARPTDAAGRFVFDQRSEGNAIWRTYVESRATMTGPGEDAEPREIVSGLVGKQLYLVEDDRGTVVLDGGPDGEEMRAVGRGMPTQVAFAGFTPAQSVEVGETFAMSAGFLKALGTLSHPTPPNLERGARPDGGGAGATGRRPGGRGEGGERGEGRRGEGGRGEGARAEGGRGEGARGAAGRQFGGGGMAGIPGRLGMTVASTELALLANDKLDGEIKGKLVAVEDGIAKIEFSGERSGAGDPTELGLGGGLFGGRIGPGGATGRGGRGGEAGGARGGRGGRGAPAAEGTGSATVNYSGNLWIDTATQRVTRLELTAKHQSESDIEMRMGERTMERRSSGNGTVTITVTVEPAPTEEDGDR